MTDERRYKEEEVAEIFESAATPAPARKGAVSSADGLTLAELQAIGREVGVAPERIADAASEIDRRGSLVPQRRELGMPISVNRIYDLPRAPTDHEWGILVSELRETFGARGSISSEGNLREWKNGNLHAYIEPAENGYRLRMATTKGNAVMTNRIGGVMLLYGLVILAIQMLGGGEIPEEMMFAIFGAAILGFNAIRLPRWASEREEQMEYIGSRARLLVQPQEPSDKGSHG